MGDLEATIMVAAKVETLWSLGWLFFPELMDCFDGLGQTIGTPKEGQMLESIYRVMPRKNLSVDSLQQVPDRVGVIELRGVHWSDWGRPERIVETLRMLGKDPPFLMNPPRASLDIPASAATTLQTQASG